MVEVDVFWSYALGAGFAATAARQLRVSPKPFNTFFFIYTLLYASILFAPSGVYLVWQFPHWETMQVARSRADLPAWLVSIFAITNVTQSILGFAVAYWFARRGKYFWAHFQWFLGYFFMFFILIYGWDGTGWQRFLYDPTMHGGKPWEPGLHDGWAFLKSNVAITLYSMGVILLPALFYPMAKWTKEGLELDPEYSGKKPVEKKGIFVLYILLNIFITTIASVVIAILFVHYTWKILNSQLLGYLIGLPLFFVVGYFLLFRKGMPVYRSFQLLFKEEP